MAIILWHDNPYTAFKTARMKKLVVAIFEDDEINRFIWKNLLKSRLDKLDVHVFDNPENGYKAAAVMDIDVVIIETHFWGQSFYGVTILSKLKEVSKKPFLSIATSALLQEGDVEKIM